MIRADGVTVTFRTGLGRQRIRALDGFGIEVDVFGRQNHRSQWQ